MENLANWYRGFVTSYLKEGNSHMPYNPDNSPDMYADTRAEELLQPPAIIAVAEKMIELKQMILQQQGAIDHFFFMLDWYTKGYVTSEVLDKIVSSIDDRQTSMCHIAGELAMNMGLVVDQNI